LPAILQQIFKPLEIREGENGTSNYLIDKKCPFNHNYFRKVLLMSLSDNLDRMGCPVFIGNAGFFALMDSFDRVLTV
jgi:hypothetical protein